MPRLISASIVVSFLLASTAAGQEPPAAGAPVGVFPAGYRDNSALLADLRALAEQHRDLVEVRELGRSHEERPIGLVRIGAAERADGSRKPAIVIVANLEGDHLVGSEVAARLAKRLAEGDQTDPEIGGTLDEWTVYVVPCLNPDGAARMLGGGVRVDFRGNARPLDRDRDGRLGEDGPDDLDGDGLALTMRVKDALATAIPDEKDPRILKAAEIAKSQTPVYSIYREGFDNDGDGLIDEDAPSGVLLGHNWPHKWPEFQSESGFSPAAEPETRALIRFLVDHPEIVALIQYGLHDNVEKEPKNPASALHESDLPFFVELSRNYGTRVNDASKAPGEPVGDVRAPADRPAPAPARRPGTAVTTRPGSASTAVPPLEEGADGALCEWGYQQLGLVAVGARLWSSPELPEPADGQPKPPESGDARWFYWNDNVVGGQAFVPFKPFDHPTLGAVEIGGWKPGVRLNPPADRLGPIADGQLKFFKDVASRLPRLRLVDAKAEAKGGGLYEISAQVSNAGTFPTALAQGVKTREAPLVVVRLRAPGSRLLTGRPVVKFDALRGLGNSEEVRWLVELPSDTKSVEIEAASARAGVAKATLMLK